MSINPFHRHISYATGIGLPLALLLATRALGDPALAPLQVETFVTEPDREVTLNWQVTGQNNLKSFPCQETDYQGALVARLNAAVDPNGTARLTGTFRPGYYELATGLSAEKFAVMAIQNSIKPRDPFFCMDAALSWLQPSEQIRASYVRILARCGVDLVRERVSWPSINPSLGQLNGQSDDHYQALRELYTANGLKILELFHAAPPWTGTSPQNPYPQDLVKSAQAWGRIGTAWDPYWGGIEIWNEPNIMFGGNLPADQYAAVAKAISYGLASAGVKAPRGGGVFTDSVSDD